MLIIIREILRFKLVMKKIRFLIASFSLFPALLVREIKTVYFITLREFSTPFFLAWNSLILLLFKGGRYTLLPGGELHIRDVKEEDNKAYRCRTKHRLTDESKLSATAGRLMVTGIWSYCSYSSLSLTHTYGSCN